MRRALPITISTPSRGEFLRWLRRVHGWMGLWGAVLGLLFGFTGFLLNHRAAMKIPALQMQQSQFQLPMPQPRPADAEAFAVWLQQQLQVPVPAAKVLSEPAGRVPWGERSLVQPAQWKAEFHTPQSSFSAEYWVGNGYASIRRNDVNTLGLLMRLHKGVGMERGWILLIDTLAGAMMLLAITGVLLWTRMRGSRMALTGLCGGSLGLALLFVLQSV
jgi:hypothetical protein